MTRARMLGGLAVAAAVVTIDALTKGWALAHARSWPPLSVLGDHVQLSVTLNPGWGFGLGGSSVSTAILLAMPVAVVLALGGLSWRLAASTRHVELAAGLAIGGTLGNLADRALRTVAVWGEAPQRVVVDFIVVRVFGGLAWPAFNLADLAIAIGMPWVGLLWLGHRRRQLPTG